jgi:hypothetical protein
MAELIDVANAIFKDKNKWKDISDEDKEKFFFIFNRYFSKKYPDKSQLLNDKLINKVAALDTWYLFMLNIPYPKWFWSKSESSKVKPEISEDEITQLMFELDLKKEDIEILVKYYPKLIKEELKYYKDAKKPNK